MWGKVLRFFFITTFINSWFPTLPNSYERFNESFAFLMWILLKTVISILGNGREYTCVQISHFPGSGDDHASGVTGQDQGCRGTLGGIGFTCWHTSHSCTNWSISLPILNHHTYILANAFIREEPGCPCIMKLSQNKLAALSRDVHSTAPQYTVIQY